MHLPDNNRPACDVEFIQHCCKVYRRFDQHGVKLADKFVARKRMLLRREIVKLRHELRERTVHPKQAFLLPRLMVEKIVANPAHAIAWSNHDLVTLVRITSSTQELVEKSSGAVLMIRNQEWIPLSAGNVGCGLRWKVLGVDDHRQASFLQQARSGQSHRATTENCRGPCISLDAEINGQARGSPRQSYSTAAVAVVVDDQGVAELLCANNKA